MSTASTILFALSYVGLGALAMFGALYYFGSRKQAAPPQLPQPGPRVAITEVTATPSPWRALPGNNRLELPSGFYIELYTSARMEDPFYRLFTPEGRLLFAGYDLPYCKALGERFCSERAEFAYQPAAEAQPPRQP